MSFVKCIPEYFIFFDVFVNYLVSHFPFFVASLNNTIDFCMLSLYLAIYLIYLLVLVGVFGVFYNICNHTHVFLNLICQCFIKYFSIYIHGEYCPVAFFSPNIPVRF